MADETGTGFFRAETTPRQMPRACRGTEKRKEQQRILDTARSGFCRKTSATIVQIATPIGRGRDRLGRSHSLSFDHRRRPETLRTDLAPKKSSEMKMKLDLGQIGYALALLFIGWIVFGSIAAWFFGLPTAQAPKAGDQCGPHHHWVYVRGDVADPDLSCKPD